MLKLILLLSLLSTQPFASVTAQWFGITSTLITDGKTTLLFDPTVTRPSMFKILTFQDINSDMKLVEKWHKKLEMNNVKGIFISHSHADHSLDAPNFAKLTGATLYGSETTANIGRSFKLSENQIKQFKIGDKYKFGDFEVEVIECKHSPIIFDIQLFDGEVKKPFKLPASYATFKMGGSFVFMISHPKGKIFFHPSASVSADYRGRTADILLQGITSRKSSKELFDRVFSILKPKKIIPLHFDDFFDQDIEGASRLPFQGYDEFVATTKSLIKKDIVEFPKIAKKMILLP